MSNLNRNTGCLFSLFGNLARLLGGAPRIHEHPYRLRDDFLSAAELSFLGVLQQIVPADIMICPKVRIADLVFVQGAINYRQALNRIDRKHVDFVLCSRNGAIPRVVVELDDRSHQRPDRMARDRFVDDVFRAASLPMLHVPARHTYNLVELREAILPLLAPVTPTGITAPRPPVQVGGLPPLCPRCNVVMVLRSGSRGSHAGKPFYGCSNYPKCRQTLRA